MPHRSLGAVIAVFLLCSLLPLSCSEGKTTPAPASHPVDAPGPVPTGPTVGSQAVTVPVDPSVEDATLLAVSKALRSSKLLTLPDACYAYRFDPAPGQNVYVVDVLENHSHAECGGDPQTQPHLLTVRIDKKTRAMSQDLHSPGDFRPLTR